MAHERDDRWRGGREEPRGFGDYQQGDSREFGRDRDRQGNQRGFFERAGDEISSWFRDESSGGREDRGSDRWRGPDRGQEQGWSSSDRDRDWDRSDHRDRGRDEERSYRPMRWTSSDRDYREGHGREMEPSRDYRPMTGDYGRGAGQDRDYGWQRRGEESRYPDRGSEWQRDPYRRTSFAGSAVSSNRQDAPYDEWRRRHMEEIDRDYDDYRRDRQQHFESSFGEWRERREGKRQMLGRIREHMDVVGSDGEHVGTVDRIAGDKVILTRSDPESGGHHHSISCTAIDRVEENRVILDVDSDRARDRWRDEDRERALFEREDQGSSGPHMLGRSFSGTYR